jgi:hypothetical protein
VKKTIVHATGVLDLRQSYQFLNGYSPMILISLQCNNDLKVIIYGEETKNIGRYLTNYQNKDPLRSYNILALLGSALTYHQEHLPQAQSLHEQNQLLIYRCFNILNQQVELSRPQVMSYLMNWNDHFTSHKYVTIYQGQLANTLRKSYQFSQDSKRMSVYEDVSQSSNSVEVCLPMIAKILTSDMNDEYDR